MVLLVSLFFFQAVFAAQQLTPATFNASTNTIHIPYFELGGNNYWLDLKLVDSNPLQFKIVNYGQNANVKNCEACATFDANNQILNVPYFELGGNKYWLKFKLKSVDPIIFTFLSYDTSQISEANMFRIPKTGQTDCYDKDGIKIDCAGTGQDADTARGADRSYTRNDNVVTDQVTGLSWTDDKSAKTDEMTLEEAIAFCKNIKQGGYTDWRVPSNKEIRTIIDYGKLEPAIDELFKNVNGTYGYYWTDSQYDDKGEFYFAVSFFDGTSKGNWPTKSNYVRCVRGNKLPDPQFERDATKKVVKDLSTGLMWQNDEEAKTKTVSAVSWDEGLRYCANLELGGYTDWSLPNANEMLSIVSYTSYPATKSKQGSTLDGILNWVIGYYLTSTYYEGNPNMVFSLNPNWNMFNASFTKSSAFHVRCVRKDKK